jgi:hypothetical protein
MKGSNVNSPYEDAYAAQQVLLTLGFKSDDVFVGCIPDPVRKNVLTVALKTQGLEFRIAVHNMGDSADSDAVNQTWQDFANDIVSGKHTKEQLNSTVRKSQFFSLILSLKNALIKKGFRIPDPEAN